MESTPNIHVGILKNRQVDFSLVGKFNISGLSIDCENRYTAKISNNKIVLTNNRNTIEFDEEVLLTPSSLTDNYFELNEVTIGIGFHWEQKETQKFQGSLKFFKSGNKIQAINILPIENYLVSVISSEMSANSSLNLLKAHAIISRSWLLAQIKKRNVLNKNQTKYNPVYKTKNEYIRWYDREDHTLFDVCADDHCQRYQGITKAQKQNVKKAVHETFGKVLMYGNGICDARFSKCCGGVTELFENCWEPEKHPYLTKVVDNAEPDNGTKYNLTNEANTVDFINSAPKAFCNTNNKNILKQVLNDYDLLSKKFYRWQIEYSQKELNTLIKEKSGIDFGDIIDFIPVERGESGRLVKLKIIGTKKTLTVGKELEIRRWLSKSHLYSSAITIKPLNVKNNIPEKFIIKGAGWGHGVGLCQIGAAVMGEKGYGYNEILAHYYKNSKIKKLY